MISVKRILSWILIALALISIPIFSGSAAYAEDGATDSEISKKLDDILSNQQTILSELASIKEELRTVKIRVTQQQ